LGAGGEGDDRGWDGWMVSPTRWTWVWVNSGSWWWTGRPGVLRFMGSKRVGHDWATELNWTDPALSGGFFTIEPLGKPKPSFFIYKMVIIYTLQYSRICKAESLCCSPEIITTLLIGYTPIKSCFKKKKRSSGRKDIKCLAHCLWHTVCLRYVINFPFFSHSKDFKTIHLSGPHYQ